MFDCVTTMVVFWLFLLAQRWTKLEDAGEARPEAPAAREKEVRGMARIPLGLNLRPSKFLPYHCLWLT